ncbi:MAG: serine/threonine protein kinase [Planctomycetes bacterium]|nr:serine/threonine protein kinase [Planctomycetota bacterium]
MTIARDPENQERLVAYVRQALAKMDAGEIVDPAALCSDHPHLARPLAEVLGLAAELPLLQGEALREDPLAGLLLAGRYRLLACLGRGAMGVVYRASDQELQRDVAVKILDARLFRDKQAEQRFRREGEALAALQHRNVVAVFDRGRTTEGIHFVVLELLAGTTLATILEAAAGSTPDEALTTLGIRTNETPWTRVVARWARDVARGLAAAHDRDLVHRDVKPSNIFVTSDDRPVLLDFGIASRANDERLTATQTTLGTPWYMPPEQVRAGSSGPASPTLDVYGLGATIYHLLAGRPPYEGDAAAVIAALPTQEPTPLATAAPTLPRDLRAIVERCLERAPSARYPTASELAADLDRFLAHQPVQARPIGAFERRWRQWRRTPARLVAVAALVLAIATAAIAGPVLLRQRSERTVAEKQRLYATLPSVLAIEGWPDERVLAALHEEHRSAIRLLDDILALDAHDLPVRLWRACLRLDLGEREGASDDLRTIAADGRSEYLRALADRYLRLLPDRSGAMAVDTTGLPPPVTPEDCYVAGFHELRARHLKGFATRAEALLNRAADAYLPARDLRLLAWADLAGGRPELQQRLHDETIALETIYGRPTARTCALRGLALVLQKRYAQAVPELERSLELRPERHGPHQNLGVALLNLGRLDDAERHLRQALRLRPFAWNTQQCLARLAQRRGDLGTAYEIVNGLAKTGNRGESWMQPDLVGSIALDEAMALVETDPEASRRAAVRAVAAYDEALRARDSVLGRQRRAISFALTSSDKLAAIGPFATTLLEEPDNAYQLANFAYLLPPTGLDERATAWVSAVLRTIAIQRALGDEDLKARLQREIDEGLRPFR